MKKILITLLVCLGMGLNFLDDDTARAITIKREDLTNKLKIVVYERFVTISRQHINPLLDESWNEYDFTISCDSFYYSSTEDVVRFVK